MTDKQTSYYKKKSGYHGYKIGIQIVREGIEDFKPKVLNSSSEVYEFLKDLRDSDRERFLVIFMDNKNQVLGVDEISIGTLNMAFVSSRELVKAALISNAANIIITHNHTSGNASPSEDDVRLTKEVKKRADMFDITLLDNLIIGFNGYYSFADEGRIVENKRDIKNSILL